MNDLRCLAERLEPGRGAFNRGEYFVAHELWEQAWHELAGADRLFTQGLIQLAAGLHHLQQGRPRPAVALLRKGLQKLADCPETQPAGFRFAALARDLAAMLPTLAGSDATTAPDPGTLKL